MLDNWGAVTGGVRFVVNGTVEIVTNRGRKTTVDILFIFIGIIE